MGTGTESRESLLRKYKRKGTEIKRFRDRDRDGDWGRDRRDRDRGQ